MDPPDRPGGLSPAVAGAVSASRSDATRRAYSEQWRQFVAWAGDAAAPVDVPEYLTALVGRGAGLATVRRRRGPFCPRGYVRRSEDRLCESVRRAYPRVCGATWGSGYLFFVPLEGVYYSDSRGDEVSCIAGDHCQVVA